MSADRRSKVLWEVWLQLCPGRPSSSSSSNVMCFKTWTQLLGQIMVTHQLNKATNNITEEVLTLLYVLSFRVKFSLCLIEHVSWSNVNDLAELVFCFLPNKNKQLLQLWEQDPITKEESFQTTATHVLHLPFVYRKPLVKE